MTTLVGRDIASEFAGIIGREFGDKPAALATGTSLVGEWLTHRVCAPQHAAAVYRRCLHDRRVLPRWHQDDRGTRNSVRGIHELAAPGAYRAIPVWSGREHWLAVVVPVAIAMSREVLAKHHVQPETLMRWARVKSGYAQARTGRQCIVRPDTVASVMGMGLATVMRCQRAAREMGLEVIVMHGRMLTLDERARVQKWGSRQRGLSNEVALTVPSRVRTEVASRTLARQGVVDHDTPSSGTPVSTKSNVDKFNLHGLRPTKKDAAPRRRPRKERGGWWSACRLASEVAAKLPWLAGEGRKRLAPALLRFAVAEVPWSAADLVAAVERATAGRGVIHPDMIRTRPAILLAGVLRRIDPVLDHPTAGGAFGTPDQVPCDRDDCDGHGWINGVDADGHGWARRCPDCSPRTRTTTHTDSTVDPWAQPKTASDHPF